MEKIGSEIHLKGCVVLRAMTAATVGDGGGVLDRRDVLDIMHGRSRMPIIVEGVWACSFFACLT